MGQTVWPIHPNGTTYTVNLAAGGIFTFATPKSIYFINFFDHQGWSRCACIYILVEWNVTYNATGSKVIIPLCVKLFFRDSEGVDFYVYFRTKKN